MKYELVIVGALETNCYLVYCDETRACAVIDPGADPEKIIASLTDLELKPVIVLNTHGHVDHIGGNSDIVRKYGVPLAMHAADTGMLQVSDYIELSLLLGARNSPEPDRLLAEGDDVSFGRASLRVIHLPGHTPGSVGFVAGGILFSGDTLFCGGVGRTDLPGGSWKDLERSIRERILTLPEETIVLPGHGPWTTVEQERDSNPFLT
ncbi:MAG TPA: MBL fold metallo-hydrolase [Candidatus Latescibacteria bacterium]|nr:MBL fold metallo-hydrolase [Candidatus Latescibacterota bacterium]